MGGDDAARLVESSGRTIEILVANAPNSAAAERAAQRLCSLGGVRALVGGVGSGSAEVLGRVAADYGVLFFNIGSQDDTLRSVTCRRTSFHVEASHAMYLDATAALHARAARTWTIVLADTDLGRRLERRARVSIEKFGGRLAGESIVVAPGQAVSSDELRGLASARPDVVLLLLDADHERSILSQLEMSGVDLPVVGLPSPITQTRHHLVGLRDAAPRAATVPRVALWDTTVDLGVPGALTTRYTTRWGDPMEPAAWAGYQAVRLFARVAVEADPMDTGAMIDHFENSSTSFDAGKHVAVSFRAWDHQLRQPLYAVQIDPDAPWGPSLTPRVGLARAVRVIPGDQAGPNVAATLDMLGDGARDTDCRW